MYGDFPWAHRFQDLSDSGLLPVVCPSARIGQCGVRGCGSLQVVPRHALVEGEDCHLVLGLRAEGGASGPSPPSLARGFGRAPESGGFDATAAIPHAGKAPPAIQTLRMISGDPGSGISCVFTWKTDVNKIQTCFCSEAPSSFGRKQFGRAPRVCHIFENCNASTLENTGTL